MDSWCNRAHDCEASVLQSTNMPILSVALLAKSRLMYGAGEFMSGPAEIKRCSAHVRHIHSPLSSLKGPVYFLLRIGDWGVWLQHRKQRVQAVRQNNTHTYGHTYIHTYIQTDRQTDRQSDRQSDRQTDRQTAVEIILHILRS